MKDKFHKSIGKKWNKGITEKIDNYYDQYNYSLDKKIRQENGNVNFYRDSNNSFKFMKERISEFLKTKVKDIVNTPCAMMTTHKKKVKKKITNR